MPTHLEVWAQLWSLYRECHEAVYGPSLGDGDLQLTPAVLEEFAVRLEAEFRKQHNIPK